jgi:putative ABC transport system permease protein
MNNLLNIKSFFKFLGKNKAYTAIDIFGLSVSLMFVILIAVYTGQELSTDNFHTERDRICVLTNENGPSSALPIGYQLKNQYPEIEKVCPVILSNVQNFQIYYGDKKLVAESACVDSTFFNFFSFRLLEGDPVNVLKDQYNAVISESFARKLFGQEDPMGKSVRISDSTSVIISGVMEDIRKSVIPYKDILVRVERAAEFNSSIGMNNDGNAGCTSVFIMTHKGADLTPRIPEIMENFKKTFWLYKMGFCKEVGLLPFNDLYFNTFSWSSLEHGNRTFVLLLLSVGLLILVFAVFNYINLTVAQAGQRAKEMATRRLLGSSRGELFARLIMESTMLTFISFIIGLFLAYAAVPFANKLLATKIYLADALTPTWIGGAVCLLLLIGLLAGLLPAVLISSAKPIDVVRGTFRRQTKMVFSKIFITFQNVITIATIAAALVMGLQIYHLIVAPLGYNKENILVVNNTCRSQNEIAAVLDELRRIPELTVGQTCGTPFSGGNNLSGIYEGKSLSFQQLIMDSVAFQIFGLQIKQDNRVATSDRWSWYLTERAFKDLELPETAEVFHREESSPAPILGVLKDFHLRSVIHESSPLMFRFLVEKEDYPWEFLVKVQGDPFAAYEKVCKVMEKVTGVDCRAKYLEQQVQDSFETQIRMVKIITVFAIIAILISLLGLLAMSTYFIQQRSQEVAIRKVFGSDNKAILIRLISNFLIYVGIAFIIATPLSWYFMNQWLADYSYQISLSPFIFLTAGLFCLLISFLAVFFQSWRAANANPVDSVKSN